MENLSKNKKRSQESQEVGNSFSRHSDRSTRSRPSNSSGGRIRDFTQDPDAYNYVREHSKSPSTVDEHLTHPESEPPRKKRRLSDSRIHPTTDSPLSYMIEGQATPAAQDTVSE